jgi:hypothetical protein
MARPAQWLQPQVALPVGQGPFHVKGVLYMGTQKYFKNEVPDGLTRLVETLEDPSVREFIQQKFLPSSWYDVLPVAPLIRAEAEVCHQTVPGYLRKRAAFQAREDLAGVYRWLLSLASPETVALKIPRLLTQIFDFGDSYTERVEDKVVHIELREFPSVLGEWYSTAFEVYAETALGLAGAKNISLVLRASPTGKHASGVELVSLKGDVHWE